MLLGQKPQKDLADTIASARSLAQKLEGGDGALGRLLVGDKSLESLQAALEEARSASKDIREVAEKLNSGTGTLAQLINDPALYQDVKKTLEAFKKAADQVAQGKGTLGKLITDSGLYDTANKVLRQISEAIEDAREQAPVSAFTSAILGGFR